MAKYDGITFEMLAKHADEGWSLANLRTVQLRQAAEALKTAHRLLLFHGQPGFNKTEHYQEIQKALAWIQPMFPDASEPKPLTINGAEDPELEKRRDHDL